MSEVHGLSRGKKRRFVPNLITGFSLVCGLFIIFKTNMTEVGGTTYLSLQTSAFILLFAGFADLMDGAVARAIHAESEFGGVFDSLADAITFGVVPPVMMLKSLSVESGTPVSLLATSAAMVFSICGVLRLVRFSVIPQQDREDKEKMKNFTGLPIPSAAGAAVSLNLFLVCPEFAERVALGDTERALILSPVMILIGALMVSKWKFPSLKAVEMRLPSVYLALVGPICMFLILFGVLYHFSTTFLLVSWGYLALAGTLYMTRCFLGRRSRTLEDFEPEDQEW